jgi:hypothetical protein
VYRVYPVSRIFAAGTEKWSGSEDEENFGATRLGDRGEFSTDGHTIPRPQGGLWMEIGRDGSMTMQAAESILKQPFHRSE